MAESITIKKTPDNQWFKRFDDYETRFTRISKKEALADIQQAREQKQLFSDDNENSSSYAMFGYWN